MRRPRSRLTFALLLAVRAGAAEPVWQTPGAEEAATARQLAAAGRCKDALAFFDHAIDTRSGDASLRRDRGTCHESLGLAAPAIDDYRAYLSMAPGAADAEAIESRMKALKDERDREEALRQPRPATPAPGSREDGVNDDAPARKIQTQGIVGWLVGLHVGGRRWSSEGYSKPTTSVGVGVDFALAPHWELDGRFSFISTNIDKTGGFGGSFGGAFRVTPFGSNAYEFSMGGSLGFESQKNSFGVSRRYMFVRANPTFRWVPAEPIALDMGPELYLGSMQVTTDDDGLYGQPQSSAFAVGYGGRLDLLWIIGS